MSENYDVIELKKIISLSIGRLSEFHQRKNLQRFCISNIAFLEIYVLTNICKGRVFREYSADNLQKNVGQRNALIAAISNKAL